jgi:alkyl sulfatase BDS1-like metallo-beta-lactamase superfamily hydrolase
MAYGLYEVVPGKIYQVRGFDLANISFIKGPTPAGSCSTR